MEGNPKNRPSVAAATVPEYKTSSLKFEPSLMPETTISGISFNNPVTAKCTQSVGVPLTLIKPFSDVDVRSGLSNVSELLAPLRLRSGATTVISAISFNVFAKKPNPGAKKPSSLLNKILIYFTT
ncbi:MAG: hypothetical protein ACD_60C00032G0026 [uncultured bacterium]|nr:MAG: hypothetical protein ACD_60C00032G0026 [uncultured bacterium]